MQLDPIFRQFRERRERFLSEWNRLNEQVEAILNRLEENDPTIQDAALIAGLREERRRLFHEYEEAADRFVDHVLARRAKGA